MRMAMESDPVKKFGHHILFYLEQQVIEKSGEFISYEALREIHNAQRVHKDHPQMLMNAEELIAVLAHLAKQGFVVTDVRAGSPVTQITPRGVRALQAKSALADEGLKYLDLAKTVQSPQEKAVFKEKANQSFMASINIIQRPPAGSLFDASHERDEQNPFVLKSQGKMILSALDELDIARPGTMVSPGQILATLPVQPGPLTREDVITLLQRMAQNGYVKYEGGGDLPLVQITPYGVHRLQIFALHWKDAQEFATKAINAETPQEREKFDKLALDTIALVVDDEEGITRLPGNRKIIQFRSADVSPNLDEEHILAAIGDQEMDMRELAPKLGLSTFSDARALPLLLRSLVISGKLIAEEKDGRKFYRKK